MRQAEGSGLGGWVGGADLNHRGQSGKMTRPNVHRKTRKPLCHFTDTCELSKEEEIKFPSRLINITTLVCPFPSCFLCVAFSLFLQ